MKLSSIDLGFLYTKSIINHKRIIMKSIVGEGKELNFGDLNIALDGEERKDHITCKSDGRDYFISDLAVDQSDTVYHSLKADRFDSTAVQLLVKTAFGIGFGYGQHATYVVSGLPVNHYKKFKDNIKSLFMGQGQQTHAYSVDWDSVKVDSEVVFGKRSSAIGTVKTVEGVFLPQPFAAGMNRILADDGTIADNALANKTLAIIDPGFGTTDVYVISALSTVEKLTFSTDTAMNHAYRLISNRIQESFDIMLPLYAIEKVVKTREFKKHGKSYDMGSVIEWAFRATAQQLVSEILNKWKNTHEVDHILVAGGGGALLYPYFQSEFSNIELSGDPQWSIVSGYDKWGRRKWKDAE